MVNSIKRFFKNIILWFFSLFPIDHNKIMFESNSEIKDNSKNVFIECLKNDLNNKYKIYWAVDDVNRYADEYKNFKNVFFVKKSKKNSYSIMFLYHCCTAKFCFYTHLFIGLRKTGGQKKIFLTHGVPIKDTRGLFWNPYLNTNIISTSKYAAKLRCKTFGGGEDIVNILGFPRNDNLFKPEEKTKQYLKKKKYNKVIIWLPTFKHFNLSSAKRNDYAGNELKDISLLSNKFISEVNDILKKRNALLLIKFHPAQNLKYVDFFNLSNVVTMTNTDLEEKKLDLYSLMGLSDALITDYSSVYIDYLLLNKPIGFELNDYESYSKGRGFIVDNPFELMPGNKITNKEEFITFINNVLDNKDEFKIERNKVLKKMHKYKDGNSSERVLKFFNLINK